MSLYSQYATVSKVSCLCPLTLQATARHVNVYAVMPRDDSSASYIAYLITQLKACGSATTTEQCSLASQRAPGQRKAPLAFDRVGGIHMYITL
jgi:hypothetical protein